MSKLTPRPWTSPKAGALRACRLIRGADWSRSWFEVGAGPTVGVGVGATVGVGVGATVGVGVGATVGVGVGATVGVGVATGASPQNSRWLMPCWPVSCVRLSSLVT